MPNEEIVVAITPTDLLVYSEDLVVPSLLDRISELYPALKGHLTMGVYNSKLKGKARQDLCNLIEAEFPDLLKGTKLDVDLIYENRDLICMQEYKKHGTVMAEGAIEALRALKEQFGVKIILVSNNSVQRGQCAIRCADNGRGEELLSLIDGFYEVQGPQAQDKRHKITVGTMLNLACELHGIPPENAIVVSRTNNLQYFLDAGFDKIIGAVNGSKNVQKDTGIFEEKNAPYIGRLSQLPEVVQNMIEHFKPGRIDELRKRQNPLHHYSAT